MKRLVTLTILLSCVVCSHSQSFTISASPTLSRVFNPILSVGGASSNAKLGFDASIDYLKFTESWFQIGLGLDFQHLNTEFVPAPTGETVESHPESINLMSLSFKTAYNLGNNFFLSANPLIDIQLPSKNQSSVDNQTGLGLSLSGGKRFSMNEKLFLTIEPMLWVHNIVPFIDKGIPERMTVVGIKVGLTLR
jgi:hypothetical protein